MHFLKSDAATLNKLAEKVPGADKVSLCLLKPNDEALTGYKINSSAEISNTIIVYRDRKVTGKLFNWKPSQVDALRSELSKALKP